jgi:fructose-bisphosphate aldolase, class II
MIATSQQYAAMLDAASAGGYALPAVNVTSSQTLNGTMRGFAEAGSDGIIQVTTGAAEYLSGGAVKDMALGARALAEYARVLADRYAVVIALHTDHAPPDKFDAFVRPLIEESRRRRQRGEEPLFHSHMFDGSTLPLEDNLRFSEQLLQQLAPLGVVLEVESGVVGGEEDGIAGPQAGHSELYTTTDDLMRVADVLNTGERGRYLLAATFGNVHGVYAPGNVQLRPEVLLDGQLALAERQPGARFQYVFHGSSGSEPDEVREAIASGVVKIARCELVERAVCTPASDHALDDLRIERRAACRNPAHRVACGPTRPFSTCSSQTPTVSNSRGSSPRTTAASGSS